MEFKEKLNITTTKIFLLQIEIEIIQSRNVQEPENIIYRN